MTGPTLGYPIKPMVGERVEPIDLGRHEMAGDHKFLVRGSNRKVLGDAPFSTACPEWGH